MAKIKEIIARTILDSRDEWTVETEITLESGGKTRASVPQGKSKGGKEVVSLPAEQAVFNIENKIAPALVGIDFNNQQEVDKILLELDGTPDKSNLGGNAMLAVSIATARALALEGELALWQYLRKSYALESKGGAPRLFANCINGGVHAGSGLAVQEYVVVPKSGSIKENTKFLTSFYETLKKILVEKFGSSATGVGDEGGFAPKIGDNIEPLGYLKEALKELSSENSAELGIDAAANNIDKPVEELSNWYRQMKEEYDLLYIEDPFSENNLEDFISLRKEFGDRPIIVGDDLTATNPTEIKKAAEAGAIGGVIIKPNQIGTVTETVEAVRAAREHGLFIIVSHRSGETNDDFIADLAWAVGADGIKLGAPARGERVAKYNRLLEIERMS